MNDTDKMGLCVVLRENLTGYVLEVRGPFPTLVAAWDWDEQKPAPKGQISRVYKIVAP